MGSYELKDGKLSTGPLASTKMACPEAIMNQELSFFKALQNTESIKTEKGLLFIKGESDTLRFAPASARP